MTRSITSDNLLVIRVRKQVEIQILKQQRIPQLPGLLHAAATTRLQVRKQLFVNTSSILMLHSLISHLTNSYCSNENYRNILIALQGG